jgi:Uma2 family endonuclease
MNLTLAMLPPGTVVYPEHDGKRMSDNTKQARWIFILFGNLCALFRGQADVFIAADLLWYPVEGEPTIRNAPDVFVAFGRPKGDRGSYRQWEEGGVPVTVAFEVLSPNNTHVEMADKLEFYDAHGVEEYYVYDPDANHLLVYLRRGSVLRRVRPADGFVSPRLGIRFVLTQPEMTVYGPDGQRFLTFEELTEQRLQVQQQADEARQQAVEARRQADEARQRDEESRRQLSRFAELSRKARRGLASAEELQELDRLEEQSPPPGDSAP